MHIDATRFPLVWLDYDLAHADSTETVLDDMSALLAREQPFVYIASGGFDDREPDIDARRKVAGWMKANSTAIVRFTKAHVHIAGSAEEHRKAEEFGRFFEKFWGYPLLIADSLEDAQAKAAELLQPT